MKSLHVAHKKSTEQYIYKINSLSNNDIIIQILISTKTQFIRLFSVSFDTRTCVL